MAKSGRFIVIWEEGSSVKAPGEFRIVVDKVTGVNYLWARETNIGGITPLLGADGKPVITIIK